MLTSVTPKHGAQGVVEVVAPDEMHYSADDAHPANASAGVADRRCGEPHRHGARAVSSASEQAAEPAAARLLGLGDRRVRDGLRHRLGLGLGLGLGSNSSTDSGSSGVG